VTAADRDVRVQALKSFDEFREGEYYWVPMSPRTAELIVADYLKLLWDPLWEIWVWPESTSSD
jgi:hypothetical protein